MDVTAIALLLGVLVGMRHALEPDHLAAVGTLLSRTQRGTGSAWLGASWGVGHAAGLLGAGVVLGALQAAMPARVSALLELVVGVMLCVLGVSSIRRASAGQGGHVLRHRHGSTEHQHATAGRHVHLAQRTLLQRPLVVGLVHGLAGSGGLLALVVAELPSLGAQLLYVGAFGAGGVLGMAAMTGAAGWGMQRAHLDGSAWFHLQRASGALSVVVGAWWGVEAWSAVWV